MRLISDNEIVLSRRNLLTLLAKLDGHPPDSELRIGKMFRVDREGLRGDEMTSFRWFWVNVEEDVDHYPEGYVPGEMDPETERATAS